MNNMQAGFRRRRSFPESRRVTYNCGTCPRRFRSVEPPAIYLRRTYWIICPRCARRFLDSTV